MDIDVRKYTNKLLELCDGMGEHEWALEMCLTYMSEDEVKDMCESNCVFDYENEDDEEEEEEEKEDEQT